MLNYLNNLDQLDFIIIWILVGLFSSIISLVRLYFSVGHSLVIPPFFFMHSKGFLCNFLAIILSIIGGPVFLFFKIRRIIKNKSFLFTKENLKDVPNIVFDDE